MTSVPDVKNEPINYTAEIRQMMHGFGDSSAPLLESAKIIEDVVLHQMRAIVYRACEVADRRGNRIITPEDFIFLMRKDKVKVQRLLKYLEVKELRAIMHKTVQPESMGNFFEADGGEVLTKRKRPYHDFIQLIDNTGELLENRSTFDIVKQNRLIRAEMVTRKMDEIQYVEYSKARHASFTNNKQRHKFSDWVCPDDDVKISKQGYQILSYLAYETVAQIIDLALVVRQDQSKIHGDAIERLKLNHCNPYTYKPYQHNMGVVIKPISPSEINEALRRYWSPQLDITGPFYRSSLRPLHPKLLAC
ncbi:transcription initiation protein SPT3 homolog [Neodiprion pinetum]|uniref:Transcription initiation protein SPT3 homolog n=1 Tax=Neodiprion lecontei TaxID=441921 RepID=A0A6J0BZK4_NEOLC|nr:transcription initiation protein SPT3 homolog [Neodiprion lecontei]XP_046416285.1 transcription initiation protein SPT3 homolog [Neodiprion fabricii]XP_046416286.1 transcription initiation protein SPT3 homolog [Neodiprion fabricii]XP_046472438.1 transcription initiation protein SPT3 homolog [Neodiprion pinetum]XP_046590074.1 transcription initiation protein SPT3 homolog [Neodiprion lecontei]XP_046609155.1 transcription initiation protein SPT3 homolog [Neodiprion virginianus]XP_046609156.1 